MSDASRIALVTGASSGIGRAIAEALVSRGLRVIGTARSVRRCDRASPWEWAELDLRDDNSIQALAGSMGELDFLVNNAGKAYLSRISDGDPAHWDEMWQVNVRGLARLTQVILPKLRDGGAVINLSSMSGHRVPPSGGFYSPTKFALRALTEALRLELRADGRDIRIGSISPGFVDTPLLNDYFAGREEELGQLRRGTRMLDPEDVASVVLSWVDAPPHVELGDVSLRSVAQSV